MPFEFADMRPEVPFAARLRAVRETIGLTQQQVGLLCGLDQSQINHYEAGRRQPNIQNLVGLAKALNVSVGVLVGD